MAVQYFVMFPLDLQMNLYCLESKIVHSGTATPAINRRVAVGHRKSKNLNVYKYECHFGTEAIICRI